jgi:parvulin-like peptidyl-prolyl isomerase
MDQKKLHLSHILCAQKFQAEDLLRQLKAGKNFADLAKKYSECSSRTQGGDLGLIDLRRLDPDFAEAASLLKPSEVSAIVRTRFGYHLILRH